MLTMNFFSTSRAMRKETCKVCGQSWNDDPGYCPHCGAPVIARSRWPLFWELALVFAAIAAIAWLTIKNR
jgi:uncharacterized paraquat-inducible protein A